MVRRIGDMRDPTVTYRARPGAYAILIEGNRVLLTHQRHPENEFQLPGGGIDPGESSIQALHREVYEETGWRIGPPMRMGAFRRFTYMADYGYHGEKICHIFVARPVRPLAAPTEPGHAAIWMDIDDAAYALGNAGDRAFLQAVLRPEYSSKIAEISSGKSLSFAKSLRSHRNVSKKAAPR